MGLPTHVIVGFEDTPQGRDAATLGLLLAGVGGAEVTFALVHENAPPGAELKAPDLLEDDEAALEQALSEIAPPGQVHRRVFAGLSAAMGLQLLAEREQADVVVLGSTHRGPVGAVALGTVGERLLHGSPCPVAVAPAGYAGQSSALGVIGVGFDGSAESKLALNMSAQLALATDAELRVIAVVPPVPALAWSSGIVSAQDEERRLHDSVSQRLSEAVDGLDQRLRREPILRAGHPDAVLREEAKRLDLLLVGSRRYGPLRAVLLGSVSSALMRSGPCPVLVMPRPADDD